MAAALKGAGYSVCGLDGDGPTSAPIDLTDRRAVRNAVERVQPQVVVHLAAISFVAEGDADRIYRVNVVGTRNLLEALAARSTGPSHVILASSANIYGNSGGMISEDEMPSPQNDYAVSKLAMEHMSRLWTDRLPITIVRPFNYSGVGQSDKFLLPKIVSHFKKKLELIELGNLDVSRDFSDVRDVVSIYARLLGATPGNVFNICSGHEHSLREIVDMMEAISGHSIEVRVNPDFVRANEVKQLRGDSARLRGAIGSRRAHQLEDTLHWMYEDEGRHA